MAVKKNASNPYERKVLDAYNLLASSYDSSLVTTKGTLKKAETLLTSDISNQKDVLKRLAEYTQPLYIQLQLLSGKTLSANLKGKNALSIISAAQNDAKTTNSGIAAVAKNIEVAAQSVIKFHGDMIALQAKLKLEEGESNTLFKKCGSVNDQAKELATTTELTRSNVLGTAIAAALQTSDSAAGTLKTTSTNLDNLNKAITATMTGFQTSLQSTYTDYTAAITKTLTDTVTVQNATADKAVYRAMDVITQDKPAEKKSK